MSGAIPVIHSFVYIVSTAGNDGNQQPTCRKVLILGRLGKAFMVNPRNQLRKALYRCTKHCSQLYTVCVCVLGGM